MSHLRSLLLVLLLAHGAAPAGADNDPVITARRAALMLEEAAVTLSEAEGARDRVAALTQTVRAYEEGLLALRDGIRRAALREAALGRTFEARREKLAQIIGVLEGMERAPRPILMLHPSGALGTVRSAMLAADMVPALHAEAEVLRAELVELGTLRAGQTEAAAALETGLSGVQTARAGLSQAVADRVDLPSAFAADTEALSALVAASTSLEAFAEGLGQMGLGRAPGDGFDRARGKLDWPVPGTLLRKYGEADAAGIRRPGLVLATGPQALVTTPWPATIRYLGPLLDYGNVMILEPGEDYLVVLAGLDQVYGNVGDVLNVGAPVGLMGGPESGAWDFLGRAAEGGGAVRTETLYIELRQSGEPIDPEDWFAGNRE